MIIFISAEKSNKRPIENQTRTKALHSLLQARNYDFTDCLGVYQGHKELSFLVNIETKAELKSIHGIAKMFDQDCILVVDNHNEVAYLLNNNGSKQIIGKGLVEVNKDNLIGDYTKINNQYFQIK